ncbi:MAG: ATP-binding protein [Gemmatimonadota bacterium]
MANYQPPTDTNFPRALRPAVQAALADTPVVLIHGPRQAGKSTLAKSLVGDDFPARYVSLDDLTVLDAARSSPPDFLASFDGPVIIDEVQRAPDLFLAIKEAVDRDRIPGRFLLTGSADVRLVPQISESLAGRIEIVTLWPLSQGEIEGIPEGFLDRLFDGEPPTARGEAIDRTELLERALIGGYPEVVQRGQRARRTAWFRAYVTTVLQREVRDLADLEGLTELPRLMALVAARTGALRNFSELSHASGLPQTTLKRYLALLEAAFLIRPLPAWSGNLGKRLIKSPRLYPTDTGLMGYLMGLDLERLDAPGAPTGALIEAFVVGEVRKQIGWSATQPTMHHFRSAAQEEVDLVLEDTRGRLVAIEVKAAARVEDHDFRHIRRFQEDVGRRFVTGLVLHAGREVVSFGPNLHAVPIAALWRG